MSNDSNTLTSEELLHLVASLEIRNQDLRSRLVHQSKHHQDEIEQMADALDAKYQEELDLRQTKIGHLTDRLNCESIRNKTIEDNLSERFQEMWNKTQALLALFDYPRRDLAHFINQKTIEFYSDKGYHEPGDHTFRRWCKKCRPQLLDWYDLSDEGRDYYETLAADLLQELEEQYRGRGEEEK